MTSYDAFHQNRGVSQPRSTGPAISSLHQMHAVANSQQRDTHVALVAAAIAAKEQYSDLSTQQHLQNSFSSLQKKQAGSRRNNILNILAGRATTMPLGQQITTASATSASIHNH